MLQNPARRGRTLGRLNLTRRERRLRDALKSLYELLEEYGPLWYEKRYHDQAEAALRLKCRLP